MANNIELDAVLCNYKGTYVIVVELKSKNLEKRCIDRYITEKIICTKNNVVNLKLLLINSTYYIE